MNYTEYVKRQKEEQAQQAACRRVAKAGEEHDQDQGYYVDWYGYAFFVLSVTAAMLALAELLRLLTRFIETISTLPMG